jgi:CRISPR-associated protein Cmr1
MLTLKLRFLVLSPLFLGGADQSAELRAPSFKGALRWWYRAIDPRYCVREESDGGEPTAESPIREDVIFGGTMNGAGQSRFLIRIESKSYRPAVWGSFNASQFNEGRGRETRNGLVYLGYTFQLRGNESRTAVPVSHQLNLVLTVPRSGMPDVYRRAVLASCWLLGAFGSLGTRSRRGFGSLALEGADILSSGHEKSNWESDNSRLPVLGNCESRKHWLDGAEAGLNVLRDWFGTHGSDRFRHPHIGNAFGYKLLANGFRGPDSWKAALNHAGRLLQDARLRAEPDYSAVKSYEQNRAFSNTPDRATFGLPLTFRGRRKLTIVPSGARFEVKNFERHASLLLLRLVQIGDSVHPLFIRMSGGVPGEDPVGAIEKGRPLQPPPRNAMNEFFRSLR